MDLGDDLDLTNMIETWENWRCIVFMYANSLKRVRKCISELEMEISSYPDHQNGK